MRTTLLDKQLIPPCGMNSAIRSRYLQEKDNCRGCSIDDDSKPKYCTVCRIGNCESLGYAAARYCLACERYPCARLKCLDKPYRTRYGMSMNDNLRVIEDKGITEFAKLEVIQWKYSRCGECLCVHREQCMFCGAKRHKRRAVNGTKSLPALDYAKRSTLSPTSKNDTGRHLRKFLEHPASR